MPNLAMERFFKKMDDLGIMVTYDDVRLRTLYSEILPGETNLSTQFSRNVSLRVPIVSSPMDTVTESRMAIAMAEAGGLGIIHRGLSPLAQAKEVERVKHRLHGRINTPITVRQNESVENVLRMREERKFNFHTFPVIDSNDKVVGLLTRNDFEFCSDLSRPVSEIMTPFASLERAGGSVAIKDAYEIMQKSKKKVFPLVEDDGSLKGMYLFSDLKRIFSGGHDHNIDRNGQLVVGAAVGVEDGALERAELLAHKHCDVFHIDTAHGDTKSVIQTLKILKYRYPEIDVSAGNVSSGVSAKRLVDAGADCVFVGQGPGSICTTRVIAGVGVPQVSAIYECARAVHGSGVPICADGGITNSGDMVIALAVGATSVMLGRLLSGTAESPGETKSFQGMLVKNYRGMGSLGAMQNSAASREKYGQGAIAPHKVVPEGVEGVVPYKGPVSEVLAQYTGGIRSGMGYNGARTISELSEKAEIFRFTGAGLAESHPHDIIITADVPNYQRR